MSKNRLARLWESLTGRPTTAHSPVEKSQHATDTLKEASAGSGLAAATTSPNDGFGGVIC